MLYLPAKQRGEQDGRIFGLRGEPMLLALDVLSGREDYVSIFSFVNSLVGGQIVKDIVVQDFHDEKIVTGIKFDNGMTLQPLCPCCSSPFHYGYQIEDLVSTRLKGLAWDRITVKGDDDLTITHALVLHFRGVRRVDPLFTHFDTVYHFNNNTKLPSDRSVYGDR
jgi:hypothetical protein